MQIYGNEHTKIDVIVEEVHRSLIKAYFPKENTRIFIPRLYIHSEIIDDPNIVQELEIDTWFLKKNRIIPLTENLIFEF